LLPSALANRNFVTFTPSLVSSEITVVTLGTPFT